MKCADAQAQSMFAERLRAECDSAAANSQYNAAVMYHLVDMDRERARQLIELALKQHNDNTMVRHVFN